MHLISFYSSDDYYVENAHRLMQQCDELGIDADIREHNPDGDWYAKTRAKPQYILDRLNETTDNLLWLDIDCSILAVPEIKNEDTWAIMDMPYKKPHVYAIYVPNNQTSRAYLQKWIDALGQKGDHDAFLKIASQLKYDILPDNLFILKESGNFERNLGMAGNSHPENKDVIKGWIEQDDIQRILDVGAGRGNYPKLMNHTVENSNNGHWTALEVFYPYVGIFKLKEIYEDVIIGDARYMDYNKMSNGDGWDLVIAADMLEHMKRDEAKRLIKELLTYTKHLLICFPVEHYDQHAGDEGNDFETHIDHWTFPQMDKFLRKDMKRKVENSLVGDVLAYFMVKGDR